MRDKTIREALVSQALEEIDGVITRLENLNTLADRLDTASGQYQEAIHGFNDAAKKELHGYVQQTAQAVGKEVTAKQTQELEIAAANALEQLLRNHSSKVLQTLNAAIEDMQRSKKVRLLEIVLAALLSAALTAATLTLLN